MKIAIIGAGAIGGLVGVKLALAGEDVTFVVRGANLDAIRKNGIKLIAHDGVDQVATNVKASNDYDAIGVQDMVILAMKAHQVEAVANDLPKLLGPNTIVVTMQNGIPFWYFEQAGGPFQGTRVTSVDPTGVLLEKIPAAHIIGCVVYPASELVAPGVIQHIEGDRFPVGVRTDRTEDGVPHDHRRRHRIQDDDRLSPLRTAHRLDGVRRRLGELVDIGPGTGSGRTRGDGGDDLRIGHRRHSGDGMHDRDGRLSAAGDQVDVRRIWPACGANRKRRAVRSFPVG